MIGCCGFVAFAKGGLEEENGLYRNPGTALAIILGAVGMTVFLRWNHWHSSPEKAIMLFILVGASMLAMDIRAHWKK